jgi:hypothetical protein
MASKEDHMPCVRVGDALVMVGNPSEHIVMANGKTIELEWGNYFGPAVVTRAGLRNLTAREFRDPNIDKWITGKGKNT